VTTRTAPLLAALAALSSVAAPARAQPVTIKLATLAPEGSSWHEALKDLGRRWELASGGRVQLRVYAGGVAGDETSVVAKMRIGQLGAALVTSHGVTDVTKHVRALGLPLVIRSHEEVDRVLEAMRPLLDRELAAGGFVALGWADAGMVRLFLPEPTADVARVRGFKLFTWAGDTDTTELWRSGGFRAVPLPSTEVTTGLQTGLVEAFPTTPAIALASQWYVHARCLLDVPIAPLVGTLLVTARAWERIPPELRDPLRREAEQTVARMREENRRMEREAIAAMAGRGLRVLAASPAEIEAWNAAADQVKTTVRGRYVPAEAYDVLVRALDEHRRVRGGSASP
jgi:TRAP-type C4-dicarboxylate transport system substrate-binding protein